MEVPAVVVLVEDDPMAANWVADHLTRVFDVQVKLIRTELGFREQIEQFRRDPPQAFVIDMILPWTEPGPVLTRAPREVLTEGNYRAGLRCQRLLAAHEVTRQIPVIFFSAFPSRDFEEIKDLESTTPYVQKNDLAKLEMELRRCAQLIER